MLNILTFLADIAHVLNKLLYVQDNSLLLSKIFQDVMRFTWTFTCLLVSFTGVTSVAQFLLRMQYVKLNLMVLILEMLLQME